MKLAELRFTTIEGTKVAVHVASAAEAKAALKELRHKKKELQFLKRSLQRERTALDKEQRKAKAAKKTALGKTLHGIAWIGEKVAIAAKSPVRSLATVDREIAAADETIFGIDSCILQLEGKLLHK